MRLLYYQKEIAYIDYYESGEKIKNIGFVKVQQKDKKYGVKIVIRGLFSTDTFHCKVKDIESEQMIGIIEIINGCGEFKKELSESEMFSGLLFQISPSRYGKVKWKLAAKDNGFEPKRNMRIQNKETIKEEPNYSPQNEENRTVKNVTSENIIPENKRKVFNHNNIIENQKENDFLKHRMGNIEENNTILNRRIYSEEKSEPTIIESDKEEKSGVFNIKNYDKDKNSLPNIGENYRKDNWEIDKKEDNKVIGDKWQQLCDTLEKLQPFENKEMGNYLSIEPKDFVILPSKYQTLVNNSFLLHGFYNYRHLILGKMQKENEIRYYIGVPGNYYEREKMVAVMFGFEAFEGARIEDVKTGTFGYYLCQVQL